MEQRIFKATLKHLRAARSWQWHAWVRNNRNTEINRDIGDKLGKNINLELYGARDV